MLEENQNLPFRERQLKTIEEGRNIRQQIEILKKFLSLYKNSQLIEIAKNYSLLVAERDKKIESDLKVVQEDSSLNEIVKRTREYQIDRNVKKEYFKREDKLVKAFFDLAKQLVQDIKEVKSKKVILYLCKSCFNTAYEDDEAMKWDTMTPAQSQKIIPLMEEQQEKFLLSALFNLMIQKHAGQKFAEKIELLIKDISEYKVDLRDKLLELTWNIAENNFEKQENKLKEKQAEIQRLRDENIFGSTTKHKIGWSIFLILTSAFIHWIRKYTKKLKEKKSSNLKEEIQDKFKLWRLNMGLSVLFYAVSFYLLQQFINKWIRPNIKWCLENHENTTILSVTGILGGLFLLDSYISSELKTPLQRLAIKIESANISEKEKKELLSKTQWSNETFKETLKRFGLLTIAGTLIKLLGEAFDKKIIANFCYAIPIAFGGWQIWRIGKKVKEIK